MVAVRDMVGLFGCVAQPRLPLLRVFVVVGVFRPSQRVVHCFALFCRKNRLEPSNTAAHGDHAPWGLVHRHELSEVVAKLIHRACGLNAGHLRQLSPEFIAAHFGEFGHRGVEVVRRERGWPGPRPHIDGPHALFTHRQKAVFDEPLQCEPRSYVAVGEGEVLDLLENLVGVHPR